MEGTRGIAPAAMQAHNRHRSQDRSSPYHSQRSLIGFHRDSYGSNVPIYAGAATPGSMTPHAFTGDARSSQNSMLSLAYDGQQQYALGPMDSYHDSPYHNSQQHVAAVSNANINPYDIADDGDDGFMPEPKRRSMMPVSRQKSHEKLGAAAVAAGSVGVLGGMMSRKQKDATLGGSYNPVKQQGVEEKSEWLSRQTKGTSKMRWMVGAAIGFAVVLAIIGGITGAVLGTRNNDGRSSSSSNSASSDIATNGDLNINSAEIQKLMNNKNLRKVFPGIDYTPWGTQYPLCATYPPSQNNVTRDMAVLSQLTNAVRLYGTDCNQTEMVLHAIERLQLKNMKVWLGVWIDTNATTSRRQVDHMYKVLADTRDRSIFKGVIIGNEALYRAGEDKAQSEAELITILNSVRSNFTTLGYNLPVATSDLGDNWNGRLVAASDYVMSNIHPFFAGVDIANAASWTWDFWQTHNVVLTVNTKVKQVISETGWPSGGGTDCGNEANTCAPGQTGSVASIANMNRFMNDWVCQALRNGTEYFWFEAFDEPCKLTEAVAVYVVANMEDRESTVQHSGARVGRQVGVDDSRPKSQTWPGHTKLWREDGDLSQPI